MHDEELIKMGELENVHWWFLGRKRIIRRHLDCFLKVNKNGNILDAGCGTGMFFDSLSRRGNVFGIDRSITTLKFSKEKHQKNLMQAELRSLPFKRESFDFVLLADVLEHQEDDIKALRELHRICRGSGMIMVTVPAYDFLWSGHDELHQHKRRYSKRSLIEKLNDTGFRPLRISYFNTFLFPLIFIARMVKNSLRDGKDSPELETDMKKCNAFANIILKNIFYFEGEILKLMNLPFGVSLFCVAKRLED